MPEEIPPSETLLSNPEFRKQFVNLRQHLREIEKIELYIRERKEKFSSRPENVLSNVEPNDMTVTEQSFILKQLQDRLLSPDAVKIRRAKLDQISELSSKCERSSKRIECKSLPLYIPIWQILLPAKARSSRSHSTLLLY